MKLDEFFDKTREIQIRAGTLAAHHDSLADWFRKLSRNVNDQREAVNEEPTLAAIADEAIARYQLMLEEGPPDGSPLGGEAAQVEPRPTRASKPRLPKGLMQRLADMAKDGPKAFETIGHPRDVVEDAARKSGLSVWATQDSGGASWFFGLPEHEPKARPLSAMGYQAPVSVKEKPAVQERNEEARAEGDARTRLAGRIRELHAKGGGLLPSDAAADLGVPIEAIRDAWPLLTGEKAP